MINLVVFDFDKTLIPYDSFNRYLRQMMRRHPLFIGGLVVLRLLRLLSSAGLKQKVIDFVDIRPVEKQYARIFMQSIVDDIIWPSSIPANAQILVLSASPYCYLQYLPEIINTSYHILATGYYNGVFRHLFGEQKQIILHQIYPNIQYHYRYALSDSVSDSIWMKEFEEYHFIKNQ